MQSLTPKEKEVFTFLTQSKLSNKQIADEMKISEFTLKKHTTSIYEKLNIQTRVDLLINFWKFGLFKTV